MTAARTFARPVRPSGYGDTAVLADPLRLPFARVLQEVRGIRVSQAYRLLVTCGACSLTLGQQEELYLSSVKGLDRHDLETIVASFQQLVIDMEDRPYTDLLGPLYMEIGHKLDKQGGGEFFTPKSISRLMAQMTFGPDVLTNLPGDAPLTCNEPACGTGGMILASAEVLAEQGVSPLHTRWIAQDISDASCYACFINLTLWSIPARVVCGNTLSQDVRWSWTNPLWSLAVPFPRPTPEQLDQQRQEDRLVSLVKGFLNDLEPQAPITPKEEPMTATSETIAAPEVLVKVKRRRSKDQPEAETATVPETEQIDFRTLAAETRAKLRGGKQLVAEVAEIQATSAELLAVGSQVSTVEEVPAVPFHIAFPVPTGMLGILEVPLSQLVRSGCNVRSHYDPAAVEELAESLASQGQLENCTGRWNADGLIEIVAGETRRRGWAWLRDAGRTGPDQPVLVHVRELSDAEALAISATENMRRRSMTPLEECEAMQRLQDAGRSVEELAAMFGYKSLQPVADRILVARNLLTTAREALDTGRMSLAQAFVIARAPGKDLQNSMTTSATDPYRPQSATELSKVFTRGQILVKTAGFNVEKSGLEVVRDIFDTFEPYFKDKAKALQAQVEHANGLAEKRRAKGDRAFVAVETGEYSTFPIYSHKLYESASEKAAEAGTVFYICTASGTLAEEKGLKLRKAAKATVKEDGSVSTEKAERQMPESAYLEAHQLRAYAAREAAVGDTHLTLALTVWGMLVGHTGEIGRSRIDNVQGLPATDKMAVLMPTLHAKREALRKRIAPVENSRSHSSQTALGGHTPMVDPLLTLLLGMEDGELLDHLNTLVAVTAYDWSYYNSKELVRSEYAQVAARTDAASVLARSFTLTDEWLKRYPRIDLIKLSEEAGLGRALVEDCKTLKEMRARLLEHAERLHREGFVPALLRFPEVKA